MWKKTGREMEPDSGSSRPHRAKKPALTCGYVSKMPSARGRSDGSSTVVPYISRANPGGRWPRLLLQGLHAPRTLERTNARSGRTDMGMTWSPVVLRTVQQDSRSQHNGSSAQTCLASRCHAAVDRMR